MSALFNFDGVLGTARPPEGRDLSIQHPTAVAV